MKGDQESEGLRPQRPSHISEYAWARLEALAAKGLGRSLFLGGALGLLHYLDYRSTRDVDAWWTPSATAEDRRRVIGVLEATLQPFGQVKTCAWGDVVSIELVQEGRTVFSFQVRSWHSTPSGSTLQVAHCSAQLEPSAPAPWIDVLLDSFPDLLASKMVALVERGAPRDFRDVYALCEAGLTTPRQCWELWRRRQRLAGSDTDSARARLAIETHLTRIAQHRPLAEIADPHNRAEAEAGGLLGPALCGMGLRPVAESGGGSRDSPSGVARGCRRLSPAHLPGLSPLEEVARAAAFALPGAAVGLYPRRSQPGAYLKGVP